MWKSALLCLMLWTAVSTEAQIFVKRSELWAYEMDERLKQNIDEINKHGENHAQYMRGREAEARALQRQLQACGNCADRTRLSEQLRQLEARNRQHDELLCGTIEMQKDFNPAVGPIAKALGFAPMCEKVLADREAEVDRQEKERFMQRMRAGDLKAYAEWGGRLMNESRQVPFQQRLSEACPWFYQGAQKGDAGSTVSLASQCLNTSGSDADRRLGVEMLQTCANRGETLCIRQLAWFHSPIRDTRLPPPLPVNEQEALRLFDLAASKGDSASAEDATRLRRKIEREARAVAGLPPLPQEPGPGAPRPWPVKEGVYAVKSPGGSPRGTCTVRALGKDRYELTWNAGAQSRVATGTVRGSGLYLDNAPTQARYAILNTGRVALLSSPQESLTMMR